MADFNIFGTVARVVINGTEWKPQHTETALRIIDRYSSFLRSICMIRIGGICKIYANFKQHSTASLYATVHRRRIARQEAETCLP